MRSRSALSLPRSHGIVLISPMRAATQYLLCLVTAPDLKTARLLARVALESRNAACAGRVDSWSVNSNP